MSDRRIRGLFTGDTRSATILGRVFVCQGGTCRSPMAVAIKQDLLGKADKSLRVAAAGIDPNVGYVMPEAINAVPSAANVKRVTANRMTLNAARLIIAREPKQKAICCQKLANLKPDRVVLLSELVGRGARRCSSGTPTQSESYCQSPDQDRQDKC